MRNTLLVIKHEIKSTLGKPSFWFTSFLFPVLIFGLTFGSQLLARGMTNQENTSITSQLSGAGPAATQKPVGYVDEAGVIKQLPESFPASRFVAYSTTQEADSALTAGTIDEYYVVPVDFLATGDISLIQKDFSPLQQLDGDNLFEYVVTYNLTGNADVATLLLNPTPRVTTDKIAGGETAPAENAAAVSMAPMVMLFIFFFVLTMSSGYMLRSVTREKESRVVEVLLLSVKPRELMLGKMLGLGTVALVQMAMWLGGGLALMGQDSPILGIAKSMLALSLPRGFIPLAAAYFLLGYLTFSSLLGALGTLAPTMREGSQFTFVILLPLMIPMMLNTTFIEAPNSALATFLSIFPLTAPVSMAARMAAVTVPWWQIGLSLGLLVVTTYGFVLLSARLFRADTLLSQAPLNVERIKKAVLGGAG